MVKLNKIYTRTGDKGDTGLTGGKRVPKYSLRVEAYGAVDEANAVIGVARLHIVEYHDRMLARIQQDLFDLGADLSTPYARGRKKREDLRIVAAQVLRLEKEIDDLNATLLPLASFVLPGGTAASAHLHHARTVVRRAERRTCALAKKEKVNPEAVRYLNRLSDFLFVLARVANDGGKLDVLWQPGANR